MRIRYDNRRPAKEIAAKLGVHERTVRRYVARPREEYLANTISAQKPWEPLGISRATWYRRRKKEYELSRAKKAPNPN